MIWLGLCIATLGVVTYLLVHGTGFFAYWLHRWSATEQHDITYIEGSRNHKHRLDVYLPKDTHNFPVVHFVHGGYWNSGDKRYKQGLSGLYGNLGTALARHGIGVVVSNYRLVPKVGIDEQLEDVTAAIAWTLQAAKDWSWNGRLYLMGHSAGGHIVSLLAASPKLLAARGINTNQISATIALSPVLDIADMAKQHDKGFNRRITYPTFGRKSEDWPQYSPLKQFIANPQHNQPLLIAVGEHDFPFLKAQILQSVAVLIDHGIHVKLVHVKGYNHSQMVTRFGSFQDQIMTLLIDFIHQGNFAIDD